MDRNQDTAPRLASSIAEAMYFRWLPITSLQSLKFRTQYNEPPTGATGELNQPADMLTRPFSMR
jgi:hypothetical protein